MLATRFAVIQLSRRLCSTKASFLGSVSEAMENVVRVRSQSDKKMLSLTFSFDGTQFNFLRGKSEESGRALRRLLLNIEKKVKRAPTEARLLHGDSRTVVSKTTPNVEAWSKENVLAIGDSVYNLWVDVPVVLSLEAQCVMENFPAVPLVEVESADCALCEWTWWRCRPEVLPKSTTIVGGEGLDSILEALPVLSRSRSYWPMREDMGHRLVVRCVPVSGTTHAKGQPVYSVTEVVMEGLERCPVEERLALTPAHLSSPESLRVVSYNILADIFATLSFFPYCGADTLAIEYRRSLIVKEIVGYHADIVCLQEVGLKVFNSFILPALEEKGYSGILRIKSDKVKEGSAIVFNCSKFNLVSSQSTLLYEFLRSSEACADLYQTLKTDAPATLDTILSKNTVVILAFLECKEKPGHFACVANTHLFYYPTSDHIRVLQTEIILRYLRCALDEFTKTLPTLHPSLSQPPQVATVFCGDFNSCPCTATFELLTKGSVGKGHCDWTKNSWAEYPKCACDSAADQLRSQAKAAAKSADVSDALDFSAAYLDDIGGLTVALDRPVRIDPKFQGVDLKHDFRFRSACGTPHYTNYTAAFVGTLDYIFVDSDRLQVARMIPFPPHERVTENVAIPSVYFPSDHIALVCDLDWKTK